MCSHATLKHPITLFDLVYSLLISIAIELVGPTWRTHVALLANVVYSFTLCLLGVVVWLVRDWRQMSLATSLPFLAYFFYWW